MTDSTTPGAGSSPAAGAAGPGIPVSGGAAAPSSATAPTPAPKPAAPATPAGNTPLTAPQPQPSKPTPDEDVLAVRQVILNGVQNDASARAAYEKLPTAHQQIVLGAAASLQKASKKTGKEREDAIASTRRSIVGGPFLQPYPEGHPQHGSSFETTAPALAGGELIWAAMSRAAWL